MKLCYNLSRIQSCEGFIRPSNPPRPPLVRGRSGTDLALIQHRFDIDLGSNQEIDVESMLNRCQIDPLTRGGRGGFEGGVWGGLCLRNPSQIQSICFDTMCFKSGRFQAARKHACTFMRTLAKPGEVWQTWRTHKAIFMRTFLTFTRVLAKVLHIHQTSVEGASVCGWPSDCARD